MKSTRGSRDRWLGASVVLLSAAVIALSLSFPGARGNRPGPAFFPRLIGILLLVAGAYVSARPGEPEAAAEEPLSRKGVIHALEVVACVVLYALLAEPLGFVIVAGVILAYLLLRLGNSPALSLTVTAALVLSIYFLFSGILQVQLPRGPW